MSNHCSLLCLLWKVGALSASLITQSSASSTKSSTVSPSVLFSVGPHQLECALTSPPVMSGTLSFLASLIAVSQACIPFNVFGCR